jgi:flagellar motor component MotA
MRIVGVIILVVGMMVGIGSNLASFIDPPSLIIIATFVLGVLWIAGAPMGTMFGAVFSSDHTPEQFAAAGRAWALARQAALAAGYVGTVVGAAIMGANIHDMGSIGPGFAICILTLLYGLVVGYGFCLPCQYYVESRATR